MAIALVAATTGGTHSGGGVTGTINTTGATLIVVQMAYQGGTTPTLVDSKSNTWTALTASTGNNPNSKFFYAETPTVGSGHTFTVGGAGVFASITVAAFSGTSGAGSYDANKSAQAMTGGTTLSTSTITPPGNGRLVISGISDNSVAGRAVSNSFTIAAEFGFIASPVSYGSAIAYFVQTTAAAISTTWSNLSPDGYTNIMSFAPAGAGVTDTPIHMRSHAGGFGGFLGGM